MTVYVLHFDPPYRHAGHYIGWTPDAEAERRVGEHLAGNGSPLVRAAVAAGSRVLVAQIFEGAGRDFERNLKDRKDVGLWCPCCGLGRRPLPDPARMSRRFIESKRSW